MIAPEQWYEYQQQYLKYGIDMKPKSERDEARRKRKEAQKNAPAFTRMLSVATGGDRKLLLSIVLIGALVLIMVVLMSSYAAKLTYDINRTQLENDALIGEIEDLDVKMMNSTNITYIEQTARNELGMETADIESCVFISADDVPEEGFADILKQKAYK
ncbi:MAG: hypothetical protein IJI74_01345 [Firmicutes bacterium]|nr:hypothetical protein [Bacillota bacterium]